MMMTMIVFNKQQRISVMARQTIASEYKSKAVWTVRCWLVSDWYCIGCQNDKNIPE